MKDAVLTDVWMATNWPTALPTPGRAVAMEDALYMIETGVARISVLRTAKDYTDRQMCAAEVAAVLAWVGAKDAERQQMPLPWASCWMLRAPWRPRPATITPRQARGCLILSRI